MIFQLFFSSYQCLNIFYAKITKKPISFANIVFLRLLFLSSASSTKNAVAILIQLESLPGPFTSYQRYQLLLPISCMKHPSLCFLNYFQILCWFLRCIKYVVSLSLPQNDTLLRISLKFWHIFDNR